MAKGNKMAARIKADDAFDKKMGIKIGSKKDNMMDKAVGVPPKAKRK